MNSPRKHATLHEMITGASGCGVPPYLALTLAKVGSDNWDLYVSENGYFYAIAKPGTGAMDSHFGDVSHILGLMRDYPNRDYHTGWTEAGREALNGANCRLFA